MRKMFGEYSLYLNGKYFAAVCDDRLLVKVTAPGQALFAQPVLETPYPGGSAMLLVEELEGRDFPNRLALTTCAALPEPKRKKKNRDPGVRSSGRAPFRSRGGIDIPRGLE